MKTTIAIIISVLIVGGAILFLGNSKQPHEENLNNVSIVDGKQIIEIKAKGGYSPERSVAKAGIPTILRFKTEGSFDCSALVRIPSLDVYTVLPNSGSKDIDLGKPKEGVLSGSCGMGMYPFQINFGN